MVWLFVLFVICVRVGLVVWWFAVVFGLVVLLCLVGLGRFVVGVFDSVTLFVLVFVWGLNGLLVWVWLFWLFVC